MGNTNKTGIKWRNGDSLERERQNMYQRKYREENLDKVRKASKKYDLRTKYGMTYEDYEELLAIQEGKCALCETVAMLAVDHCHETGKVRGLLCNRCNLGIGLLKEDTNIFKRALEYLS